MGYTPAQKASIEHVDGPLLISAGAGSGKTFTLTRRIAWALTPGSAGEGRAFVDDIDQVLAITFTEKAAREIKARVRSTLRQEGLVEQALKVDAAWISTIHGMCSRILKEHALSLGMDPAFSIVGDQEQRDLLDACIEEALGAENELLDDGRFGGLVRAYGARGGEGSVQDMLSTVLNTASGLMDGLDAFELGPELREASRLALEIKLAYEETLALVEAEAAQRKKPTSTMESALVGCPAAIEELEVLVERGCSHGELLSRIPALFCPKKYGSTEFKAAVDELRSALALAAGECEAALARPHAEALLALARDVEARYQERLDQRGALDMDGLLRAVLRAFRERPDMAAAYADRFKLVMVDEFQDTNQLQIDMISYLVGDREQRLCTVGDAQQSIYAFRGADVSVYEAHKARMRSPEVGALDVRLDANFRSNAAILSFAERIFQQGHVFGDGFLHLDAGRDESRVKAPYHGSAPRIDIVDVEGEKGVVADDRADFAAEAIAERFERLRAEGHESRDMVVLLGTMARSVRYAEILRAHGFDCVITGGSTFASFPEVRTVGALLSALANPADTQALFAVLTSDVFGLSADDVVDISTKRGEDGLPRRRSLAAGLRAVAEEGAGSLPLRAAVRALDRARRRVGTERPSRIVEGVLRDSGALVRCEQAGAQGVAQAANVLKAVRLVEDFEADGAGLAQVARSFARFVDECGKDKPGALTASERNYVQIMTVHASKGLEFPIVALADCWKVSARETAGNLLVKHARGTVYCSLRPGRADEAIRKIEKAYTLDESTTPLFDRVRSERSAFAYRELLKAFIAQESLEERRRCFYVAVTRASEALIPVFTEEGAPIVEDVRTALCGDGPWPEREGLLDYGGAEPARFTRVTVTAEERDAYRRAQAERAGERPAFAVPEYGEREPVRPAPWRPVREGMWSYSSLSEHAGAGESEPDECEEDERAIGGEGSTVLAEGATADALAGCMDGLDAENAPDEDSARAFAEPAMAPSPFALDDDAAWEEIAASLAENADRATDLGSAFHLIAQCAVEERAAGMPLACPSDVRVRAVERACRVTPDQAFRLRTALDRWFASETAAQAAACESVRAEVPFCIAIDAEDAHEAGDLTPDAAELASRGTFYLEGEIDLLCEDGEGGSALVVDYKTGGCADETPERLQEKHGLQARCYALAVLRQGTPAVELRFVRVEQEDGARPGQPQEVVFRFDRADLPALEDAVRAAWRKANG